MSSTTEARWWRSRGSGIPTGLHMAIDGGYDLLSFRRSDFDSVTEPFVRFSAGWNGERLHTRAGYEQGLDEGGGILTDAKLRRTDADARIKFTDRVSLDLSVLNDVRQALDVDGVPEDLKLQTFRGVSTFSYGIGKSWAALATYAYDKQTTRGTDAVPTHIRANRYGVGFSWRFD